MFTEPIALPKARRRTPAPRVARADASRYLWIAFAIMTLAAVLLLSAPAHATAASGQAPDATNFAAHGLHRQPLVRNAGQPDKPTASPYARAAATHQVRAGGGAAVVGAPTMVQAQGMHHRAHRGSRPL